MINSKSENAEKNKITIIILCAVIIIGLLSFKHFEKQKKIKENGAYAVSVQLGHTVQHRVMKLTPSNAKYLKESKEYGTAYNQGKLLVIYPYPDGNSPFSKVFAEEFDKVIKDPKYTSQYEFLTFPENPNNQFFQTCHAICFINPKKDEILYISRTGNEAGYKLPLILDGLLNW